jgi:hypothetical protein
VRWAVIVLVCTIVQIALGTLSRILPLICAVHGAVALVSSGCGHGSDARTEASLYLKSPCRRKSCNRRRSSRPGPQPACGFDLGACRAGDPRSACLAGRPAW